jgi:hypothetical protein
MLSRGVFHYRERIFSRELLFRGECFTKENEKCPVVFKGTISEGNLLLQKTKVFNGAISEDCFLLEK